MRYAIPFRPGRRQDAHTVSSCRAALWAVCLLSLVCGLLGGLLVRPAAADDALDFTTIRLGTGRQAVLVVGGIQGDEPGGFSAATLLGTRYEIQEGAVWVVPNLNFPSIIRRSRGLHGDMNRKFARLDREDPEFHTVSRIKDLIGHPDVRLVLNLHDGSGYYRPTYIDKLNNPRRWGQCIVIDQARLENVFMGELHDEAHAVISAVNERLLAPHHTYHIHNTRTAEGDREMEKSLSYYAVRQGKAAFGLEASKEFPVELRVYYHLQMIENFLHQAGVRFQRGFELTPDGIRQALRENLGVAFAGNRVFLPLEDVRDSIRFLPLPRDCADTAVTSKPIMAVLPCPERKDRLCIHYGNRTITLIEPDWHEMDESLDGMMVTVDGKKLFVGFGQVVRVYEQAVVHGKDGYRVNAIGLDSGRQDESGLALEHEAFQKRFSVDRQGKIFRVEVYRGDRFSGLFLLRFGDTLRVERDTLPDSPGRESALGF